MSIRARKHARWLTLAGILLGAGGLVVVLPVLRGAERSGRRPGGEVPSPGQHEAALDHEAPLAPLRGKIIPVGDWPDEWWSRLEVSIYGLDKRARELGPRIKLGRPPGSGPVSFRTKRALPAGQYRVRVAPHGLERVVDFAHDGPEAEIPVGPPVTLRVRIYPANNALVREAELKWSPIGGGLHATSLDAAPFNVEGQHFELLTVPGRIWFRIDAPGYRMVDTSTSIGQLLDVRGDVEHVVQLLPAVRLQVSVRFEGHPVRATVLVTSSDVHLDDHSMTTDEDGIARFSDVGEGPFSVLIDDLPEGLVAPAAREVWLRADNTTRIEVSPTRR